MAIVGIGYGNTAINNMYQNNRTSGKRDSQGFDENCIMGSKETAQSDKTVSCNKDINPLTVDPRNASYEEIQALNAYLVKTGLLKEEDLNAFERPTQDDTEKADYYNSLRKWRDIQYHAGNMVGYKNAAKVCDAWTNAILEMEGKTEYIDGIRVYCREAQTSSGIIGFGSIGQGEDFRTYTAQYASDSTIGNPIIEVRIMTEEGTESVIKVNVNQIDPANATQLEMFALCSYADAQKETVSSDKSETYRNMLSAVYESEKSSMQAHDLAGFLFIKHDWTDMVSNELVKKQKEQMQNGTDISDRNLLEEALLSGRKESNGVPYSYLAKDGIIEYKGVVFVCDEKHKALCLGDTSNPDECLNIPLSGGGSLIVNRKNLGDLAKAIGMFSPEDVNLIMRAIAQDAKIQQMKNEIDDETSGINLAKDTETSGKDDDKE